MKGWRLQPFGWLFLAVLVGFVVYFAWKWLRRPPPFRRNSNVTVS